MARKFVVSIDLNKNELQNARIHNLASAPGTPVEGQFYYHTVDKRVYVWNGTAFELKATDSDLLGGQNSAFHRARANHTGSQLAATISDFDTQVRLSRLDQMAVPTASVNFNGQKGINGGAPSDPNDFARLVDVQNSQAGFSPKDSVRFATTAAGTLATDFDDGSAIDGGVIATGDRLLIKNQAAADENGFYIAQAAGAPVRSTDADSEADLRGAMVLVEEGTTNAGSIWTLQTDPPFTVDTDDLVFVQFAGAELILGGAGLVKTGSTLDVVSGDAFIVVNANNITIGTLGIGNGGTGQTTASAARIALVATTKFSANVGDNAATQIDIVHNLATRDIVVLVREAASPWAEVECDVEALDTNTVRLRFAVAPTVDQYRVIVVA